MTTKFKHQLLASLYDWFKVSNRITQLLEVSSLCCSSNSCVCCKNTSRQVMRIRTLAVERFDLCGSSISSEVLLLSPSATACSWTQWSTLTSTSPSWTESLSLPDSLESFFSPVSKLYLRVSLYCTCTICKLNRIYVFTRTSNDVVRIDDNVSCILFLPCTILSNKARVPMSIGASLLSLLCCSCLCCALLFMFTAVFFNSLQ